MKTQAERRSSPVLVGGGAAIAALLALMLFMGRGPEEPPAVVPAPARPPQPVSPPAVAATPALDAPVSPQGLRLFEWRRGASSACRPEPRLLLSGRRDAGLARGLGRVDHALPDLRRAIGSGLTASPGRRAAPAPAASDVAACGTRRCATMGPGAGHTRPVSGHVIRPGLQCRPRAGGIRPATYQLVNGAELTEALQEPGLDPGQLER